VVTSFTVDDLKDDVEKEPLLKLDELIHELNGLTSKLSVSNPNITLFIAQAVLLLRKALKMLAQIRSNPENP